MKRVLLMMAAVASVASAMPASPAFARDGDKDRRAERAERQQPARGRGLPAERRAQPERRSEARRDAPQQQDQGQQRWDGQERRQGQPRYDDRRRYDEAPTRPYADSPRPNYMSPAPGVAARRGMAPDNYRSSGGVVDDYRRYRLRPPPQGYDWVRMGNGFALVERGSGRVFDRVN